MREPSSTRAWRSHSKQALDIVTSVILVIAAGALLWRMYGAGAGSATDTPVPPRPQAIEALDADKIVTTVRGVPLKGRENARSALIEFSDLECPFCARHAAETFERINTTFVETGEVQYAFRHFPLAQRHPSATRAAQASACAGDQGAFWHMRAALFGKQSELALNPWAREAAALGLDLPSFDACLEGASAERVQADIAEGMRLGIASTPTFLIGEVFSDGEVRVLSRIRGAYPYDVFERGLREVLDRLPARDRAQSTGAGSARRQS
jgi:protein-disulfide isomerase